MSKPITDLRQDYQKFELLESNINADPIEQFKIWFDEVQHSGVLEPNAMTVSTISKDGQPHARIVLLKEVESGSFVFYTNYNSTKGKELTEKPFAALTFWWDKMQRQINISGSVEKVSREQSNTYFQSRPLGSKIGAWVSNQSEVIPNRDFLEKKLADKTEQFSSGNVPLPDFWGGFRVIPTTIEFWQGRTNRLHDRLRYTKIENGLWKIERLSP